MARVASAWLTVRIDPALLQRLDDVAAKTKPTRSGIIISLIEKFLDEPITQALASPLTTSMPVECGWCGRSLTHKDGLAQTLPSTSICLDCLRIYFPRQHKRILKAVHNH